MTEQYIRYAAMFIIIMMAVIDDYRRFRVSNRIIIAGMVIGVVINMGRNVYNDTDSVVIYVSNNYRRGNVDSRRKNEAKDVYAIYTIFIGVISVLCYWRWNYIKNFITVTVVSV